MADKFRILLLNGPNLNMLGTREPEKYGTLKLSEIVNRLESEAAALNVALDHLQSNAEYALIDRIHQAKDTVSSTLINPAVLTPTWFAKRDTFRHHSCFPDIAVGALHGAGAGGYSNALQTAVKRLSQSN